MPHFKAALGCAIVATLLSGVFHPRLFYGSGSSVGFSIVNLDGLFFAGQWAALVFSVLSLALSVQTLRAGHPGIPVMILTGYAALLIVWLIATGIPHRANRNEWRTRELGIGAFLQATTKQSSASSKPVRLTAAAFDGTWMDADWGIYTFYPDRVTKSGRDGNVTLSKESCGAEFSVEYRESGREELARFPWSARAAAMYEAAPMDAKIPTALVICGNAGRWLFVRATADEVWRWTSELNSEEQKADKFILRRTEVTK